MTPRTASLRVAHRAGCENAGRTALESLRGCTCAGGPSYYTSFRDHSGRTIKGPRIKNRRVAEAALRELQVELDKGRVGWTEERNIEFPGWVDEYETILDRRVRNGDLKAETPRSYLDTLRRIAIPAIGYRNVRAIGMPELRNFDDAIGPVAASSRQKHFRQLSACLATAVDEGYADRNPVSTYRRKYLRGTRTPKQGSGPFTDGELARLWPALEHGEPVYLSVCQFAVATGLRQGELIALDWQDIDLLETEIHVRHTWNPRDGLTAPKDKEERTVELTQPAIEILSRWMTQPQSGSHEHGPVFCPPRGERLNSSYLRRVLDAAMADAGIPKVDPSTGLKRTFHSLRRTFTRQMLEQGRHPQWVELQLGHSSLDLTIGVYGSWSRDAVKREAAAVK